MSKATEYKGITILANCKCYSQWTIDEEGRPYDHYHDFEGVDVVGYTTDEYPDVDFETLDELYRFIDEQEVKNDRT